MKTTCWFFNINMFLSWMQLSFFSEGNFYNGFVGCIFLNNPVLILLVIKTATKHMVVGVLNWILVSFHFETRPPLAPKDNYDWLRYFIQQPRIFDIGKVRLVLPNLIRPVTDTSQRHVTTNLLSYIQNLTIGIKRYLGILW